MTIRGLELFSGACGSTLGYIRAGFEMTAIDHRRPHRLPSLHPLTHPLSQVPHPQLDFHQMDVLSLFDDPEFPLYVSENFDFVHAGPPCQPRTHGRSLSSSSRSSQPNLLPETRDFLESTGLPWVIENVPAPPRLVEADPSLFLRQDLLLCGSMFPELHTYRDSVRHSLRRHRIFEANFPLTLPRHLPQPVCDHRSAGPVLGVYHQQGEKRRPDSGETATLSEARELMGIGWMGWRNIREAIPPAYTTYISRAILRELSS